MVAREGSAFIGVSLDSRQFTRQWIRYAIDFTLSRHNDVEFFLGDRLLWYNKVLNEYTVPPSVSFRFAASRAKSRREEIARFLTGEIAQLSIEDLPRVRVSSWQDYSDHEFVDIARRLHIAFVALPAFRACVEGDVVNHFSGMNGQKPELHRSLSSLYVLEETAMIVRITELTGKSFDYYPEGEVSTLRALYLDEFAAEGLSVESLIGGPKRRVFTPLPLPKEAVSEPAS